MNNQTNIFIIPTEEKPLKIVFESLPCPIFKGERCEHAKNTSHGMIFEISCTYEDGCNKLENYDDLIFSVKM